MRPRSWGAVGRLLPILVSVVLLVTMASPTAGATPSGPIDVIIAFTGQPGPAEVALVRREGGTVRGIYSLVPAIAASIPSAASGRLLADARVVRVELDREARLLDLTDTDTTEVASAWGVDRLDANVVWSTTSGAGVGVAVVDTGSGPHVDLPDAVARLICLSGTCEPGGIDDNGHGTHVAGTVLATSNGIGVVGVAHGASLFSYKVLNSGGSGSWSGIIAALDHIVAYNTGAGTPKIRVANFSLGSSFNPGETVKAAFDNAYASGLFIAAAAGNSGNTRGKGDNVIYPAKWDSTVAVAATDKNDKRASFSSTGPKVELAAPGVGVNSTYLDDSYKDGSGTSMATPHVSGAAALVIASGVIDTNRVNGIADEVRAKLTSTAKDLGATGRDNQYGYGLVNPAAAVGVSNTHF